MNLINIDASFLQERPLSYSSLKEFRKSPKHYQLYLQTPKTQTPAMLLGSVVDCLLLEPERFDKRFMIVVKGNMRTNAGKEEYARDLLKAQELNLTLVDEETVNTARLCVASLMDHNMSRAIIEGRKRVQLRMKWTHKATGLPMIGYVDFESRAFESDFIIDLKTAATADPDDFSRNAAKLDYHIQAGAYMDGYPRTQHRFPSMAFLVVETSDPFNVSLMFCDSSYLNRAADEYHGSMNAFKYCMDNNLWHMGYDFRTMGTREYFNMELPGYVRRRFETVQPEIAPLSTDN